MEKSTLHKFTSDLNTIRTSGEEKKYKQFAFTTAEILQVGKKSTQTTRRQKKMKKKQQANDVERNERTKYNANINQCDANRFNGLLALLFQNTLKSIAKIMVKNDYIFFSLPRFAMLRIYNLFLLLLYFDSMLFAKC